MRLFRSAVLVSLITLTACASVGKSKLNPFNWFGGSKEVMAIPLAATAPDDRLLIETVLDLKIDKFPGGAIVRATGLPPTQGYWDAELVAQPVDYKGRLVLDFRIFPPISAAGVVNQQSREVLVGLRLSNIKLQDVRQIIVQGAKNARSSSR